VNNKFLKALVYIILPVALIIYLFSYIAIFGIAAVIAYVGYILYTVRAGIFTSLGSINYSKGRIEKALAWFDKAYKSGRAKPMSMVSYAYLLLKTGNIEESESILNTLIRSKLDENDKLHVKSNLALVLWKKGELDNAITMLQEAFEKLKTSITYGSLGYLLILKGDMDRALEFNLEAYEYNNSNAVILDNLGQTYYITGDYDKAEETYEKLMQINPSFPEAYYNYGLVLMKKGKPEKALHLLRKSMDYKLTFLSTVTKEAIESAAEEAEKMVNGTNQE